MKGKSAKKIVNLSDAEFSVWLCKLPANLKERVHGCAFRYGLAREAVKAARNNEAIRQRVDDRRVALHHALDAAFAWISSAYEPIPSPPEDKRTKPEGGIVKLVKHDPENWHFTGDF